MALPAYFQPNALDFRPVTSAVQNYGQAMERRFDHQTGELVGARLAVNDLAGAQAVAAQRGDLASSVRLRQLGMEDERFQFARELHPLDIQARRVQTQAAQQSMAQAGAMHPLQLAQSRLAIETAQDELAQRRALRTDLAEFGVPSPAVARVPGIGMPPAGGAPATGPAPAAPAPSRPAPPNYDELGARFIQDHIINVPPELGESRFGVLMNDPVFGPALRQNGLDVMNWRDAANTMAGVMTTQPAPAATPPVSMGLVPPLAAQPTAAIGPVPGPAAAAQPPGEVSREERIARRMIASGIPAYVTQGREMLESINKNDPARIIAREAAQERGKQTGQAQVSLPGALRAGDSMLRNIEDVIGNANLPSALGPIESRLPTMRQSTAEVESRLDQIQGQAFLQAFEALKGGGAISEREGAAAAAAIARLTNRIQSPETYRAALNDARREIHEMMNVARQKAGQPIIPFVPYDAITALRGDRTLAAQFDTKYGVPHDPTPSRRYLGTR